MGVRAIVLALVVVMLIGLALEATAADDEERPQVCVSAVGPVDASGRGETTPHEAGECPEGAP